MSFQEANKLYQAGRYKEALRLYTELKSLFGGSIVQFNIDQCLKKIEAEGLKDIHPEFLDKNTPQPPAQKSNWAFGETKSSVLNELFDHVYVVNLKHHVEKRLKIAQHLQLYGVNYELFEAVNGYKGEPLTLWNNYKDKPIGEGFIRFPNMVEVEKKRKTKLIESAGAIGYIFSYVNILKDAKSKGFQNILILEDDILLDKDFDSKVRNFMNCISSKWKVLQFGASQYGWKGIDDQTSRDKGYYHPRRIVDCTTCGSFAMAINMEIADELIEAVTSFEAPFDHAPLGYIYEKYLGECFVCYPNIVMPDVSDSSIRGKRDQASHAKRVRWVFENFDFPLEKPCVGIIIQSSLNLQYLSKFTRNKKLPFDLRLFIDTDDGLRAVHNADILEYECNKSLKISKSYYLDGVDYLLSLPVDKVLNETDIVEFLECRLGLLSNYHSCLYEIENKAMKIKTGRASVIIPTFSRPKNLENAIISVIEQDYPDIEVIVVSDNGIDSPFNHQNREIVERYKNKYKHVNIRLIEHDQNRNGSAARNTGFLASTGEFISFLDDDDVYLPGRLSKVISLLKEQDKSIGAVYCGFLGWNSKYNDLQRYSEGDLTEDFLGLNYFNHYVHTNTVTYRRQSVVKLNGFDESYRRHQDLEFNLRFFENYQIAALKETLVRLKPEPTDISNVPKNISMLEVKIKFLNQFGYLIEGFPEDVQYEIYQKHIEETLRHIKDEEILVGYYRNNINDFKTQLLLKFLAVKSNESSQLLRYNELEKRFTRSSLALYRIIGNNHPLLQNYEQTVENLKFILNNETDFENVDKIFVLNKITNPELRQKLLTALQEAKADYVEIEYDQNEYAAIGYDFNNIPSDFYWFEEKDDWIRLVLNTELRESKNRYLINNNGARNFTINDGKQKRYKWIMPWDGNCFLSDHQMERIKQSLDENGGVKYVLTPMQRALSNETISKNSVADNATEEPQITFRFDATELFNEQRVYGNQPKVELFKRLGIPGVWDDWKNLSPWKKLEFVKSLEAQFVPSVSSVFRLSSGNANAIKKAANRNILRKQAIIGYIDSQEIDILQKNISDNKSSDKYAESFKGFIPNHDIRKVGNQIIYAKKHKKESDIASLSKTLIDLVDINTNNEGVYALAILFVNDIIPQELPKRLAGELLDSEDIKSQILSIYKDYKPYNLDNFCALYSKVVSILLCCLAANKLQLAVQLKAELAVLTYFYCKNIDKIGRHKSAYDLIYMCNFLLKTTFGYDMMKDLYRVGLDRSKLFT